MSYQLYDENGFVADLASNGGFRDVAGVVDNLDTCPTLKAFFDNGYTDNAEAVVVELEQAIPQIPRGTERQTLLGLMSNLQKVKDIAIIRH